MSTLKNIAIFGGSGALGTPLLKAIVDSGKFNVTAITRATSKATFPENVKVVTSDYNSLDSLTAALKGQDAVVSAVGTEGFLSQKLFFDAAVAAGVKRFIPSEFGSNLEVPKVAALVVFGYKIAVRKHIEEKVAAGANITYTYLINSGYLDWGLDYNFLLNWAEGKPEIYDGGDRVFSTALLSTVGKAVVGVLTHPDETKNRQVQLSALETTQNKLLEIAKRVDPKRKWEPIAVNTKDVEKSTDEARAKGDFSGGFFFEELKLTMFGEGYGQPLAGENKLLGIVGDSDSDIEAIWKRLLL